MMSKHVIEEDFIFPNVLKQSKSFFNMFKGLFFEGKKQGIFFLDFTQCYNTDMGHPKDIYCTKLRKPKYLSFQPDLCVYWNDL